MGKRLLCQYFFQSITEKGRLDVLDILPLRYPGRIHRMVEARWLLDYSTASGASRVFRGLSRRASPGNPLSGAEQEYYPNRELYQGAFAQVREDLASYFLGGFTPRKP